MLTSMALAVRKVFLGLLPALITLALMVWFGAMHWPFWAQSFSSDFSPAAWLSSALLLAASLLSARLGIERALYRPLAIWLALALFVLALDEQFMLHERWKYGCERWVAACVHAWVRELPTYLVMVLGAISLMGLAKVVAHPAVRVLVGVSLSVGLFALVIDLMELPGTLGMLEEGFEVLAEALFIGALLVIPSVAVQQRSSTEC
jgi:hypothetical protein